MLGVPYWVMVMRMVAILARAESVSGHGTVMLTKYPSREERKAKDLRNDLDGLLV